MYLFISPFSFASSTTVANSVCRASSNALIVIVLSRLPVK